MSIKIVTDSCSDIPSTLVAQHGITVVPLYVNFAQHSYKDGLELSREAFYRQLPALESQPTTAAPAPAQFQQVYRALIEQGATEIISVHVAGSLSATVNHARQAASQLDNVAITVLDSGQLSLGLGFLALTAARAAQTSQPAKEIVALLEAQKERTHLFAGLDTLEFLRRSGRVSGVVAGLGAVFKIKPLLKMYNGVADSERVRTQKRANRRLVELLANQAPLEQVALIHTNAPAQAEALRQQAQHLLPQKNLLSVEVTPVIGTHVGPGAAGFVCVSAER